MEKEGVTKRKAWNEEDLILKRKKEE